MDSFTLLEQKVTALIDTTKKLKENTLRLTQENTQLHDQIIVLQEKMMTNTKHVEDLDQEKAMTSLVVDELLKNIDSIIETENNL